MSQSTLDINGQAGGADLETGTPLPWTPRDCPLLRMPEARTKIEAHVPKRDNPVTDLGEPVLPSAVPALRAAIFAATGKTDPGGS